MIKNNVTWKVEGVNWSVKIKSSININPVEIATKAIEKLSSKNNFQDFLNIGIFLFVSHSKMKSENETFLFYSPIVFANAGLYNQASKLNSALKKLIKHHQNATF